MSSSALSVALLIAFIRELSSLAADCNNDAYIVVIIYCGNKYPSTDCADGS